MSTVIGPVHRAFLVDWYYTTKNLFLVVFYYVVEDSVMAKKRGKLDFKEQSDEVLKRLKSEPPGVARERLNALRLGLGGKLTLQEIASTVGRSRATIQT